MGTNINIVNNGSGMISGPQNMQTRNTEARRAQEAALKEQKDSVDVSKNGPTRYSASAEPAPFKDERDAFSRMKKSSEALQDKLKNQGMDQKQLSQDSLEFIAKKQLDAMATKINEAKSEGKLQQIRDMEKSYEELKSALSDYQISFEKLSVETVSKNRKSNIPLESKGDLSSEEQALLKEFHETTGLELKDASEVEVMRGEAFNKLKLQATELTQKKNALESEVKDLKTSSVASDKMKAFDFLKVKESDLTQIKNQLQDLQSRAVKLDVIADKIVFLKAKQDLMSTDRDERLTASSEKETSLKTSSVERSSGSRRSSSASSGPATSSPSLSTASAHGSRRGGDRLEQVDLRVQDTGEREAGFDGSLEVQEDRPGNANAVTQEDVAVMLGSQSTYLATQSTTTALNQQTRRTENEIKKLIRAIQAGNYEALSTAMIMIDKRATQSILNMGLQTIKAMDYYDKQTAQLSRTLGNIRGNDTGTNARLAQVNVQMNQYSSNRSAITSFLRDTMTAKEEITSATRAFQQKRDQISSIASR